MVTSGPSTDEIIVALVPKLKFVFDVIVDNVSVENSEELIVGVTEVVGEEIIIESIVGFVVSGIEV